MNTPLLLGMIGLLVACAGVVYVRPHVGLARAVAGGTLGFSLAMAARALSKNAPEEPGHLLFSDPLSGLFLSLTALVAFTVLLASPPRELTARTQSSVLFSLAASMTAYCASDLTVFAGAWMMGRFATAVGLPNDAAHARLRRAHAIYATLGTAPLLAALVILYQAHDTSFVTSPATTYALSKTSQHVVFCLLAMAAAFRSGLFPLHSWLPALTGRAPVAISAMIFGAQLGPLLVARAIVPLTPLVAQGDLSPFSTWAVLSALYTSLVGIVQRDMKRAVGFVLTSQSALLLFGMSGADAESTHGALLGTLALGVTAAGLLLVTGGLQARTGSDDVVKIRGRGRAFPRMTALFFLFAAAAIGLPGTLSYVSEDLVLHGLLRSNTPGAVAMLVVTVLNGITLLRLFFGVFQGPTLEREPPERPDLSAREGLVIAALWGITLVTGISPRILLALQERSVHALFPAAHEGPVAEQ